MTATLTPADVALHTERCITPTMLERMQVHRVSDVEARELLALPTRTGSLSGILYPYLDPETGLVTGRRLRRDQPEFEQGKPKNKYLSGFGDRKHLYFVVATVERLHDPAMLVIIVESEKAAMAIACAAERLGRSVVVIALGGCFGWRGRIGKVELPNGGHTDETGVLPDFDRVTWRNRRVVLVFDTNARTNPNVQTARRQLATELTRRGAQVHIGDLEPEPGVNGPDDVLARHGAAAFFATIDAAPTAPNFDVIFRLNQRHAVVREGGRTLVVTDDRDPILQRRLVTRSSFADFQNYYANEWLTVGVKPKTGEPIRRSLGQVWVQHPDRRQYQGVVLSPNQEVPGYWNLWRGFAVEPQAGTCDRFRAHVYDNICAGNAALYDWTWDWMAMGVQHPEAQAETALVLRGGRGTGKGIFARTYGSLFGQHFLHIANARHLTGNFNAHLQDAIVLFADEAFWAGDKAGESVLKMLVTEPVLVIERKGQDVFQAKNFLHVLIASNHEWVVPAGFDERRFCVLDVDEGHQGDVPYFNEITAELDAGGRAALLEELLHHPITSNLREPPATAALREQKVLSLSANERWLFDKLMTGRWLKDHERWEQVVAKDVLHDDYITSLLRIAVDRRNTQTELGIFLARVLGSHVQSVRRTMDDKRRWAWQFDELPQCRAAFDRATRSSHPWEEDT